MLICCFSLNKRHRRIRTCTKAQSLHALAGEAVSQRKEVSLAHRKPNAKAAEGGRGPERSLFLLIDSEQLPAENADAF